MRRKDILTGRKPGRTILPYIHLLNVRSEHTVLGAFIDHSKVVVEIMNESRSPGVSLVKSQDFHCLTF